MKQNATILMFVVILSFCSADMLAQPVITKEPSSQGIIEGQTATFSIEALGSALSYQWYKDNALISGAEDAAYTTPAAALSDNNSKFKCIVTNVSGSDTSTDATLYVTATGDRVTEGLQLLYNFNEAGGTTINDNSGVGTAYNLGIDNPSAVTWTPNGLGINDVAYINSNSPATKVINACKSTNEITLEVWVIPAFETQLSGARILTLSQDSQNSDFSILQNSNWFDFRLRTTTSTSRGEPPLSTPVGTAKAELIHLVFTRASSGEAKIYKDGVEISSGTMGGNFSTWNSTYRLQIANEFITPREWFGTYHLISVYDRALSQPEVVENFNVGVTIDHKPEIIIEPQNQGLLVGQTATFSVLAVGDTALTYQWRKGVVNIPGADSSVYTIASVSLSDDDDEYSCIVSNSSGSDTSRQAKVYVTALSNRVTTGELVLYNFQEGTGDTVKDVSGYSSPLNLKINTPGAVQWKPYGLKVNSSANITSISSAAKINNAVIASGEFTFETWVKPENITQVSAAILTLTNSTDASRINFTVNQQGNALRSWLRTSTTPESGELLASLSNSFPNSLVHIVYTHSTKEVSKIFINGSEVISSYIIGNLSNWNPGYFLKIANSASSNNQWHGLYNLISIYGRALNLTEIQQNHTMGPIGSPVPLGPGNLAAQANVPGKIELTWIDNSNNEDGFIIERKKEGLSFSVIDSVSADAASYTDSNVADTTNYTYRVNAFNFIANSAYSNEASVKSLLFSVASPTNLTAVLSLADSHNVYLEWQDNSANESGFIIERKLGNTGSANPFDVIDSVASDIAAFTDSTVDDTTTYTYRVRAFNADTLSAYSNLAEITTPVPVELTSFTASAVNGAVILAWETATEKNNAGFSIQRSNDNLKFEDIAYIRGKGTTAAKSVYRYTDKSVYSGKYFYRLKQVDYNGTSYYFKSVEIDLGLPKQFVLQQNFPNPFNPATTIRFALPVKSKVVMKLFNALGQELMNILSSNDMEAGFHEASFNGSNLSSGVYFYRLEAVGADGSTHVSTKRMILMK